MDEIPDDVVDRRDRYCMSRGRIPIQLMGFGVEGFVWRSETDSIVKVHLFPREFRQEVLVYQKLQARGLSRLRGFWIPELLDYDRELHILELTFVTPPFILDFATATLDAPPSGTDWDTPEWRAEKRQIYGKDWPDV